MTGGRRFDVVGLGVSTLDFMQIVDELPGHELVQQARDSLIQGGGPVATAMVTLARLGSRTAMVDKVGDDWRGRLILEEFIRKRVTIDWIRIARGATSSMASVLVRRRDGARAITFSPGSAGDLHVDELPVDLIAEARILHMNGRHFEAAVKAARIARANGVKVSFDGGSHRCREGIGELIRLSDICIVAREFALAYSGFDDQEQAGRMLLDAGPETVVITAGEEGSTLFAKGMEVFHQPAYRVESPVDTTGAGDAFHGAFLHGMLRGFPLNGCLSLATAVAAMNTRALGGRSALPTFNEAEQSLSEMGIDFDVDLI